MSGIYQKQVNSGSVAAPSAGRTLISVNESGELFTKDSSGNVIVYPTSSAGGGGGCGAAGAAGSAWGGRLGGERSSPARAPTFVVPIRRQLDQRPGAAAASALGCSGIGWFATP